MEMLSAGATAFRLNTSHMTIAELNHWLERLSRVTLKQHLSLPVVLDLQGSKWRLGDFSSYDLVPGQSIQLLLAEATSKPNSLPVPHADFFRAAQGSGGEVVLNDAKSRLVVESIGPDWLRTRVIHGGVISARKGVTFSSSDFRAETFSEKDRKILEKTSGYPCIRYAISYVKDAVEMHRYRMLVGSAAYLIAKLERGSAIADAREITQASNEIWMCRGDLGAELGLRNMAEAVALFSKLIPDINKPSIMAGQVLEHMTLQPNPTRSEVCYLRDTLEKGYSGFVLSDETAIGQYPVESCRVAALFC